MFCRYGVEPLREALILATVSGPLDSNTKLLRATKVGLTSAKSTQLVEACTQTV
jgi:hypothetical protein